MELWNGHVCVIPWPWVRNGRKGREGDKATMIFSFLSFFLCFITWEDGLMFFLSFFFLFSSNIMLNSEVGVRGGRGW